MTHVRFMDRWKQDNENTRDLTQVFGKDGQSWYRLEKEDREMCDGILLGLFGGDETDAVWQREHKYY